MYRKKTLAKDLETFLRKIIPWDTSIILLEKGIIAPIREEENGTSCEYPRDIGEKYFEVVMRRIYDTAIWAGIENINSWNSFQPREKNNLTLLAEIIYLIHEKNFHILGLEYLFTYAKISNRIDLAEQYKEQAIRIVLNSDECDQDKRNKFLDEINNLYLRIIKSN